jgi:hypothetical protein
MGTPVMCCFPRWVCWMLGGVSSPLQISCGM